MKNLSSIHAPLQLKTLKSQWATLCSARKDPFFVKQHKTQGSQNN